MEKIFFGTAWYPEHWPKSEWKKDLRTMRAAGMNLVRLGEFAWSSMEPEEGSLQLDWLDEAVSMAYDAGMDVVLCTPTAAPPAWVTHDHPEILPIDPQTDHILRHGERCHYDRSNTVFRERARPVIEALAVKFGRDSRILGWQLDNEANIICRNQSMLTAFRTWLKSIYGTLDNLNEIWMTKYWSQHYTEWEQIDAPTGNPNPALYLAWHRYQAESVREFHDFQIALLRPNIDERQWITHNFHLLDFYDRTEAARNLDFISFDAYVWDDADLAFNPIATGVECDRIRGIQRKNFWMMETQPGFINWRKINYCQDPGLTRIMGWHFVGHGADSVLYWQWRPALACQEQYHGTLVHAGGTPRPVYEEVAQLGNELEKISPYLIGTVPRIEVSLYDAWQDRLVLNQQRHHKDFDTRQILHQWYRAVREKGFGVEVLPNLETTPASSVLIAPYCHLVDEDTSAKLKSFVEGGGTLILGPRAGYKDIHNRLHTQLPPGPLGEWIPLELKEFYALREPVNANLTDGTQVEVPLFAEWMVPTDSDVSVIAHFASDTPWLGNAGLGFEGRVGQGKWIYWAGVPTEQVVQSLLDRVNLPESRWTCPSSVEYICRENANYTVDMFLNCGAEKQVILGPETKEIEGREIYVRVSDPSGKVIDQLPA